jgi:Tol biopolymer transport system component
MAAKPRFPRPPLDLCSARSARPRLARCLAVAGLAAGSTALLAPAAGATFPGKNGRIVFADAGHIVSMNPDGSDRRQLTTGAGNADPAYSASGRRIVFSHKAGKHQVLDVMRADGTDKRQVTRRHHDFTPAFSPNGRRIVFSRTIHTSQYQHSVLFSVRSDGANLAQLTHRRPVFQERDYEPSFSPSGKTIVYAWAMAEDQGVDRIKSDGSKTPFGSCCDADPSYAPNGKRVLGVGLSPQTDIPTPEIVSADAAGNHAHDITANQDPDFGYGLPSYSPDATKIVFDGGAINQATPSGDIYTMNADTTGLTRLTHDGQSFSPDWGARPAR